MTDEHRRIVSIQYDETTKVVRTDNDTRLELLLQGEAPPPAEMIFKSIHNVFVTITTAGKQETYRVSGVTSESPVVNLGMVKSIIKTLQHYVEDKEEKVNDEGTNATPSSGTV